MHELSCHPISASYSFGRMSPIGSNVSPTKENHTEAIKTDMTSDPFLVHWDKPIWSGEMLHGHAVMKPAAVTHGNRPPSQCQIGLYPYIIHFQWWLHQIYLYPPLQSLAAVRAGVFLLSSSHKKPPYAVELEAGTIWTSACLLCLLWRNLYEPKV